MDPVGDALAGLLGGLGDLSADIAATAVGAVMEFLGKVVEGMAVIANGVISQLPDAGDLIPDMPTGWLLGFTTFNTFLPLSEGLAMAGTMLAIYAALGVWKLAVTVYHLIPKPLMGT